jgi:hypothetical protein
MLHSNGADGVLVESAKQGQQTAQGFGMVSISGPTCHPGVSFSSLTDTHTAEEYAACIRSCRSKGCSR